MTYLMDKFGKEDECTQVSGSSPLIWSQLISECTGFLQLHRVKLENKINIQKLDLRKLEVKMENFKKLSNTNEPAESIEMTRLCDHLIQKITYHKHWKLLEQWEFEASMWQKKEFWM
ncbi:uncharacterized protein LOC117803980 [Ailuropoda melanoleuca]|uniref:uncharacterized protein LOC117803980 n=1 Tax=Ailuropoda melanoleuca TaxID=9646 RepID=UPI001494C9EF|nr:uncharacterized protein LOC117803980 [Ailuropoda melanoleuca]